MTAPMRIVAEKRLVVSLITAVLVGAVGVYVLGVYPMSVRVRETARRQAAAVQALAVAQQGYDMAQGAMQGKIAATSELDRFYRELLPRNFAGARSIIYPRLARLARVHDLVLERRSSAPEGDEDSQLLRLRTSMLLAGAWPDIRKFLHELESAPEFVVIEEIVLSQSEELGAPLVLTLGVSTYYRQEPGA